MKQCWLLVLATTFGCSSSSQPGGNGVNCGGASCGSGEACCLDVSEAAPVYTCRTSCPTTTLKLSCDGPEDCGSQHCCVELTYESASSTMPNCIESGRTSCAATCQTTQPAGANCVGSGTLRLCRASSDCAGDGTHTNCCGDATLSYCVTGGDKMTFEASGGACT